MLSQRLFSTKYLMIIPLLIGMLSTSVMASSVKENPATDTLYKNRFPGGGKALSRFISKNMHYPRLAQEANAIGLVTTEFLLSPDGSVTDVKTITAPHKELGQEAERVLSLLPKFNAAKKTEKVSFTIMFLIQDDGKPTDPELSKLKADVYVIGYGVKH